MKFDVIESIEKFGWKKTLLIIFVLSSVPAFFLGKNSQLINQNQSIILPQVKSITDESNYKKDCESDTFQENFKKWNFQGYRQNKSSFCAPSRELFPPIWHTDPLPILFESVDFSFRLPQESEDNPIYAIFIGYDPKLIQIYLYEGSPQLIGINIYNILTGELERKDPIQLSDIPLKGSEITLKIRTTQKSVNQITYQFNLSYIPINRPTNPIDDPFSIDISVPIPDLRNTNSTLLVGFGTKSKSCIVPTTYKICK